ncbi:hypothetical protein VTN96DRAFT_5335 [Rasamsonia emersonii]
MHFQKFTFLFALAAVFWTTRIKRASALPTAMAVADPYPNPNPNPAELSEASGEDDKCCYVGTICVTCNPPPE